MADKSLASAVKRCPTDSPPVRRHETADGNLAFVWDITQGAHPSFKECDLMYSEPAWRAGYVEFAQLAGRENPNADYEDYLEANRRLAADLGLELYMTGGKHNMKSHEKAGVSHVEPFTFNGFEAYMYYWGDDPISVKGIEPENHHDWLLTRLAEKYERVLDPNCGYGIVAHYFDKWTITDINAQFIGEAAVRHP